MTNSPLGKYAQIVAAIVSIGVIGTYLFALLFGHTLEMDQVAINNLGNLALLALGAVLGSAVAVNGWKQPLDAAHTRLDTIEKEVAVTNEKINQVTGDT